MKAPSGMEPAEFLRWLKIQPLKTTPHHFPETSEQHGFREGGTGHAFDIMAPIEMDMCFKDVPCGKQTLGRDFSRLEFCMKLLNSHPGIVRLRPRRMADLGGGSGVLSIWMAYKDPTARFVVVDPSQNSLDFGKSLCEEIGILNVTFENKDYKRLNFETDFDFVMSNYSLDLQFLAPEDPSSDPTLGKRLRSVLRRYKEFAQGMKTCMDPDGLGLLTSGDTSFDSVEMVCRAIRKASLSIDWDYTRIDGCFQMFLKSTGPDVLHSYLQDAERFLEAQ